MKVTKEKGIRTERMEKERHIAEERRSDKKMNTPHFKGLYFKFGNQIVLIFLLLQTENVKMKEQRNRRRREGRV